MKTNHVIKSAMAALMIMGMASCSGKKEVAPNYFEMQKIQDNTSSVLWNPEVYDFEAANQYVTERFELISENMKQMTSGACTSWRNGQFHGRNLDWYQSNYGCLIVQMPKGGNVKHASVATVNASTVVTQDFINQGVISDELRKVLPATSTDGINDAGVAVNINIVPHQPGDKYIGKEGDISSVCVVRYVLDNAGSVSEAIDLLSGKSINQSIVALAGDEAHYMISNQDTTAVVEFPQGEMTVTYFTNNGEGWYSPNGNPAVMANFYDCVAEQYPAGSEEFYNNHPTAMGVERWQTVKAQFDNAKKDVASNYAIANSVWYFKSLMTEKKLWYSENAVPGAGYGMDEQGWYYMTKGERVNTENAEQAMKGYWDANMENYWQRYEQQYGSMDDPHVAGNMFWETSHSVVFDIQAKKGYLYPFENRYSQNNEPIVMEIPE